MNEYKILIPVLRDSNKQPHCPTLWEDWEGDLMSFAGGYTLAPPVQGAWRDSSGTIIRDISRVYHVCIPDHREMQLWDMIRQYGKLFDQQCLLVSVISEDAQLVDC